MNGQAIAPAVPGAPEAGTGEIGIGRLLRGPTVFGGAVAVFFFVILGGWAALAPLSSGAVAPGMVSPDSSRKVIQHLEGGIIRTLHVKEGQRVAKGAPLITLEATRAEASHTAREAQWLRLLIVQARLDAQSKGLDAMKLPDQVAAIGVGELGEFIKTQQDLFTIRQTTQEQQEQIYLRQIDQMKSEIAAVQAESDSLTRQLALMAQDLLSKEELLKQQLVARSVVLSLQREKAALEGTLSSSQSRIARARQSIEETQLSLLQAREKYNDQVAEEQTQVNNQLSQTDEDMVASSDVLKRTEIVSPVDGVVLNLRNQTQGGVIRAGEPIMDIVPANDDLIVIARIQPRDIDVVQVGLPAHVTLLPFASRNSLPLNGEVTQVAPDSTLDEGTHQYYFEVRVRIGVEELARQQGLYLSPGMPADVTVVTGERTMLQYLLDPFIRSIQAAFVQG